MPRPSAWNNPTTAIRVPAHAVDAVIALAKQLDQGFVQNDATPTRGPVIVAIGEERYLCQPPDAPPETWELADQLIDQHLSHLDQDGLLLAIAHLAPKVGRKISA